MLLNPIQGVCKTCASAKFDVIGRNYSRTIFVLNISILFYVCTCGETYN